MKLYISTILILVFAFGIFGQDASQKPISILWEPTCNICDHYTKDGILYRIFKTKDFTLSFQMTDDGDYHVLNIFLLNTSDRRIEFNPNQASMAIWKSYDDVVKVDPTIYMPIAPEKIAAKIESRAKWANFFSALGGALATETTTVNSTGSGNVSIYDNRGNSANGTYTANSNTTITSPNKDARRESSEDIAKRNEKTNVKTTKYTDGALRANTLFAGDSIGGNIYFPRKKYGSLMIGVFIEGTTYIIMYSPPSKK